MFDAESGGGGLKFKIVFVGDQAVGKTSLINRFAYDSFEATYQATIGIDFVSKQIIVEDKTIKLQLWDTAGQERFKSLIPSYIRDSSVAIVIYDLTNRKSFGSTDKWIEDVKDLRGTDVIIVLVGNKYDIEEKREVTFDEAAEYAKERDIYFMESSAKTGGNVKELFKQIVDVLPIESSSSIQKQPLSSPFTAGAATNSDNKKKKSNCC